MTDPVVSIATLPELLPGRHLLEGQNFGLGHLTLVLGESPPGKWLLFIATTTKKSSSSTPGGAPTH
jgi:hypothetical protein